MGRLHLSLAAIAATGCVAQDPSLDSTLAESTQNAPLPIPGGQTFGTADFFHVWAPGPEGNPFYNGPHADPSPITNFRGVSMIEEDYSLIRTAVGSDGSTWLLGTDMRVFKGTYRNSTGDHTGTFCFI